MYQARKSVLYSTRRGKRHIGNGSLIAFVVSLNLHRRHLNESQRAMVAAKLANLSNGQRASQICEAVTQPQAAGMLGVSERSVNTAKQVQQSGAPELVAAVEQGTVAVSTAAVISSLTEPEQREVVARGEIATG